MKESTRGAVIIIVIVVVALFLYMVSRPKDESPTSSSGPMQMNETAPDFTNDTIAGEQVKLSDYIGEKPVVLDFWATWCGPCMRELPLLQEFYRSNSADVEIIAVTSEDSGASANIQRVVSEKGLTFPIIHDPSRSIADMYPSRGIPYLVFIDIDGTVVHTALGFNQNIASEIKERFGL